MSTDIIDSPSSAKPPIVAVQRRIRTPFWFGGFSSCE